MKGDPELLDPDAASYSPERVCAELAPLFVKAQAAAAAGDFATLDLLLWFIAPYTDVVAYYKRHPPAKRG